MPSTVFKGYALVDCNSFYVSCERLFKPQIEKKPVVVLSSNDGCIIARSNESKKLGLPIGAPIFMYQHLIDAHSIYTFSPNFSLYSDMSNRVMEVLYSFSQDMQIYSIDEAFIPITVESLKDFFALQKKVKKWTGIPVTVGLGPTKTLAKAASFYAKKNSLTVFSFMEEKDEILKEISVEDIWGIGRKTSKKLISYSIYNALQLKGTSHEWMRSKFHLPGLRTLLELQGKVCSYPETTKTDFQKSLVYSKTFGTPIEELKHLQETVAHYTAQAASKLRKRGLLTQIISLYLKTEEGVSQSSLSLTYSTNTTPVLIDSALLLLKRMYKKTRYKKAGIYFWQLSSQEHQQFDLRSTENPKHNKLMHTLDQINGRYGQETLFYLAEGFSKPWGSKSERLSQRYTTSFDEILEIMI